MPAPTAAETLSRDLVAEGCVMVIYSKEGSLEAYWELFRLMDGERAAVPALRWSSNYLPSLPEGWREALSPLPLHFASHTSGPAGQVWRGGAAAARAAHVSPAALAAYEARLEQLPAALTAWEAAGTQEAYWRCHQMHKRTYESLQSRVHVLVTNARADFPMIPVPSWTTIPPLGPYPHMPPLGGSTGAFEQSLEVADQAYATLLAEVEAFAAALRSAARARLAESLASSRATQKSPRRG